MVFCLTTFDLQHRGHLTGLRRLKGAAGAVCLETQQHSIPIPILYIPYAWAYQLLRDFPTQHRAAQWAEQKCLRQKIQMLRFDWSIEVAIKLTSRLLHFSLQVSTPSKKEALTKQLASLFKALATPSSTLYRTKTNMVSQLINVAI